MNLPQRNKSAKIGRSGISILNSIVEDQLGWLLRWSHQEDDFGIDAFIDLISEKGHVTGKSIALQVKTGQSYFRNHNKFGWKYFGEMRHPNYTLIMICLSY